jgi:capsule biosynthesis phosphatase
MVAHKNVLVVDIDGTLCAIKEPGQRYEDLPVEPMMLARLRGLVDQGWRIILHSSRGMRTHDGNVDEINREVLPVLLSWLEARGVPFHELHMGKPWAGDNGFYVDDRAVRPREFVERSFEELAALCARDRLTEAQ